MRCFLTQIMMVLSLQRWDGTQPDHSRANTLLPNMQVWRTQLPAKPHVPQLLETAPNKKPPSHTSNKRTHQQPGLSQVPEQPCSSAKPLYAAVAEEPVTFQSHRPLSQSKGKACPFLHIALHW